MRKTETFEAYLDDLHKIRIFLSKNYYEGKSKSFYLKNEEGKISELRIDTFIQDHFLYNEYICFIAEEIEFGRFYQVYEEHARSTPLEIGFVVKKAEFDKDYAYTGDLGVSIHEEKTVFRLWAPTATGVRLVLDHKEVYASERKDKGVYECSIAGNLHGHLYYYLISVNGKLHKSLDPYGLSSSSHSKASAVIDRSALDSVKKVALAKPVVLEDVSIIEMSIRDFSSGLKTENWGTFKAVTENTEQFDYLTSLGFSHVQLMPVNDFATVDEDNKEVFYNWGYDPYQYFALEGSYARHPQDPLERMLDFKELVAKFHERGMRVNLDVVFNHVYDVENSPFDLSLPYYYFRFTDNLKMSNGSYCGNDLDSKQVMMRRYILDVLKFYVDVYDVDGFRFDLMGILDLDTLNEIAAELKKIKPDIMLYGEGWNMPTALKDEEKGSMFNSLKLPDYAFFNDFFRDISKGCGTSNKMYERGYLTGDKSKKEQMALALTGYDPYAPLTARQMINYVECHDNLTLWDKIKLSCKQDTKSVRIDKQKLVTAAVFLAQGIPFMQLGQEFGRSKNGVENSYRSDDEVNMIDWNRLEDYRAMSQYVKDLLSLRNEEPVLRNFTVKRTILSDQDMLVIQIADEMVLLFNASDEVAYREFKDLVQVVLNEAGTLEDFYTYSVSVNPYSVVACKLKHDYSS